MFVEPAKKVRSLLEQLHSLKAHLGPKAHVMAYAQQEDLEAAAQQLLGEAAKWRQLFNQIGGGEGLCSILSKMFMSSKRKDPDGTWTLSNAHKVLAGGRGQGMVEATKVAGVC